MANYDTPTGTSGTLRMVIDWTQNIALNRTTYTVSFQVICSNPATFTTATPWSGNTAGIARGGGGSTFAINGVQTVTVGSWTFSVDHDPDGTLPVAKRTFSFTMSASGTSGLGGPTTNSRVLTIPAIPRGIWFDDGTGYKRALVYVDDGTGYKLALPYVDDGTAYKLATG